MLKPRHLAVIRAALRYWDEEQSPHGPQAFADYVDPLPDDDPLTGDDTRFVREALERCALRYVLCDEKGSAVLERQLFVTPDAAEQELPHPPAVVATVLLF